MTTKSNLLRDAAQIVSRVSATLDTSGDVCPSCQLLKKHNWAEAQIAAELEGVVRKLERAATHLDELAVETRPFSRARG